MDQFSTGGTPGSYIPEVIAPGDSRPWTQEFGEARMKQIQGLMDRRAFQVVLELDVPDDANILGGQFVMSA